MGGFAWVTLATNDSYSLGALVLAHSLKRVNTAHQLAIMITPGVSEAMKTQLSAVFNIVRTVDVLDSRDQENLALLARPELGITFTKLHCWKFTQFDKCVFLDADTIVLQNSDELFEREELSAAPDVGWPDCFNSGVFVFKPSEKTFKDLIDFALVHGTFDGGDQGLLNLYFSDWATKDISKHLPFVYNVVSSAVYTYLPAFKQFKDKLKIIHFIGSSKPWLQPFDTETGTARVTGDAQSQSTFIQLWWDLFCAHVHPTLTSNMSGLAGAISTVKLGVPRSEEETALQEHLRRQGWEEGNIDYMGRDSFDNIWKKISETLASGQSPSIPTTTPSAPSLESSLLPSESTPVLVPTETKIEAIPPPPMTEPVPAVTPIPSTETVLESPPPTQIIPKVTPTLSPPQPVSSIPTLPVGTVTVSALPSQTITEATSSPTPSETVPSIPTPVMQPENQAEPVKLEPKPNEKVMSTQEAQTPIIPISDLKPTETTQSSATETTTLIKDVPSTQPTESIEPAKSAEATPVSPPSDLGISKPVPAPSKNEEKSSNAPAEDKLPSDVSKQIELPAAAVTPVKEAVLSPTPPLAPASNVPVKPGVPTPDSPISQPAALPTTVPKPASQELSPSKNIETSSPQAVQPSSILPVPEKPPALEKSDITPPASPGQPTTQESKPVPPIPTTPTVTSPTPPTSPAATPQEPLTVASKLKVQPETPPTPPVPQPASQPTLPGSTGDEPPVPPKRKGGKSGGGGAAATSANQGETGKPQQQKGGKGGKGKK